MSLSSVGTGALCAVLGAWLLCSAIAQYRPLRRQLLRGWDLSPFGPLLPVYTFFAPRPATRDLRLLLRYWAQDTPGPWQELLLAERWRWFHVVWNPTKRQGKALSDLIRELARLQHGSPEAHILSNCYLQLLTLVDAQTPPPDATHVQFAVVETTGFNHPGGAQLYFASERHRLSTAGRLTGAATGAPG
jgi:hypothetical protein